MEIEVSKRSYTPENIALLIAAHTELSNENSRLSEENLHLKAHLEATEKRLSWLMEQIKLNKHRQFSRQNEKSEYFQLELQLELAFDENGNEGVDLSDEVKVDETEMITYSRSKKAVGRRIDTSKLPREVIIHDLSEDEKHCNKCGGQLEQFGEDRSEQLEYIPAQVKVYRAHLF
jgi:hypothetical protein